MMIGSDGGINPLAAAGLVSLGMRVSTPEVEPELRLIFGMSVANLMAGGDNTLKIKPEPGITPEKPVVAEQRMQPPQQRFS